MGVSASKAHKIIAYTAHTESGGKYDSWNPDDNGAGISYGIIQFNQAGGRLASRKGSSLADLLKAMNAAAPAQFRATFGPHADHLLSESWVKQADFNDPDLKKRMLLAATIPAFQQAQLELARKAYFIPAEQAAAKYGIKSERGHAMLFDTAVQWGPVRMEQFLRDAASKRQLNGLGSAPAEKDLLADFAQAADAGKYTRRTKMLTDMNLSDASIVALGVGGAIITGGLIWLGWKLLS